MPNAQANKLFTAQSSAFLLETKQTCSHPHQPRHASLILHNGQSVAWRGDEHDHALGKFPPKTKT
jgi:hypothetical protein